MLAELPRFDLHVERCVDAGLRWHNPTTVLHGDTIAQYLQASACEFNRHQINVVTEVDSTNSFLLESDREFFVNGCVCTTEAQSRGRGRRGRPWVAVPYQDIMLSIGWWFDRSRPLSGLSLAVGMTVADVLHRYGVEGLGVKWPNDLVWRQRKLGGVLIDSRAGQHDLRLVVGIGLNVASERRLKDTPSQAWVGLTEILGDDVDRNRLVADLIGALHAMFIEFARVGFAPWRRRWGDYCVAQGKTVRISDGTSDIIGDVQGIDSRGALLVCDATGATHRFLNAEVTMRMQS
jgi:BirA family biotin operon repressor/biotin-[acetyl-CoA-carboxylase] ligase